MSRAQRPTWLITYENADISADIVPMVTAVTYTDHLKGKSDELELVIEDSSGLWRSGWYPSPGDRIEAKIGYENQPLVACGRFEVDKVELDGPPDVVTIRALAAGHSSPLRTQQSRAFEGLSLDGIVRKVANEYGYEVVGTIEGEALKRVSQANESTLAFLARVAEEYGFVFSLRGERLVFYSLLTLEQASANAAIDYGELTGYSFTVGTQRTYVACEVAFKDPESGKLMKCRVEADNVRPSGNASEAGAPTSTIQQGSRGDQVRDWQRFLLAQSLYSGSIDGVFGSGTLRGTRAFQRESALGVDGKVGRQTYAAASAKGFKPSTGDVGSNTASDVLRKQIRCESVADAETKAKALLRAANRLKATGSLELPGNQMLVAGTKVELTNIARLSGQYTIERSSHRMTRSGGYSTSLEVTYV